MLFLSDPHPPARRDDLDADASPTARHRYRSVTLAHTGTNKGGWSSRAGTVSSIFTGMRTAFTWAAR